MYRRKVIPILGKYPDINVIVKISTDQDTRICEIKQVLQKEADHVFLSSGDEIYIDKVVSSYDYFFKWYFRNRIGNFYQFCPSYQWSGFRGADDKIIGHYVSLLNKMHIPYAWQVEGRTLASSRLNPPLETLTSPMFKGKQAHENDGGYYYWRHFLYEGLFSDMAARTRPYGGIFAKHPPIYTDYGVFIHYDPHAVTDMADGADKFVSNLKYSRGESTWHTGPSTMFRYLYQAGYQWLGAEQMYGPENTIMSTLRGASRAYDKKNYGSLHAVQWGSFPFTDPKHSLRFYMSLTVAYMHGSSHINTEEGLWTDEYANDRFTQAGKEYLYAQHQILDYIKTHSRRGDLYTKIAILQGRNCAWKSFGRGPVWSQAGEKWKFNKATESFDLLKIFYLGNNIDSSGPEGWFTSTPYGPVDILPIEADIALLNSYKILIFLGRNSFEKQDFEKIENYVFNGGTILLTAAHLNTELQPDLPVKIPEKSAVLSKLLGPHYQLIQKKTELKYGQGKVIFYSQPTYPIDDNIKEEYVASIREYAQEIVGSEYSKAWIGNDPFIDFTVWDEDERRTLYVLNIDWQSDESSHQAHLYLANSNFTFDVPLYTIRTIHCFRDFGILPFSNTSDVLDMSVHADKLIATVQTTTADRIVIFKGKTGESEEIHIAGPGIHKIIVGAN